MLLNKDCSKCGATKNRDEFSSSKNLKDGKYPWCKECCGKRRRITPESKHAARKRAREWRLSNPEWYKRQQAAWKYNCTLEFIKDLWEIQSKLCAVCSNPLAITEIQVDHDHLCCPAGKKGCGNCIRGLLCRPCNHGMGQFFDNVKNLRRAADYLESFERNK